MTPLESFTSGQPLEVDVNAIERELAALWKEATVSPGGGTTPAVMRACQLNLVVWCSAGDEAERAASTIVQVVRVRPSRVLLAVVDPAAAGQSIEAFISAHCSWAPGEGRGRQVCCEQVTLSASGTAAERLPAAVLPLLLPDLPVVLWWPGDPDLKDAAALRLVGVADRIVLDSRRVSDVPAQLGRIAALERPVSDLSWQRLRAWRETTAGLFDGPAFADYPQRIDAIEIEHAGDPAACAEGLLLASWAASRMRWRPGLSGAASNFGFDRPDGAPATLRLAALGGEAPPGRILSLTLRADDVRFMLRRVGDAECVRVTISLPDACPLPRVARVVARDDATLLSRCLESGGRDDIYDEALHLAARLAGPMASPIPSTEGNPR